MFYDEDWILMLALFVGFFGGWYTLWCLHICLSTILFRLLISKYDNTMTFNFDTKVFNTFWKK